MTTSPDAILLSAARKAVERLYNTQVPDALLQVEPTRKDFEGDYTLVVFPLLKITHSSPEMTAKASGKNFWPNALKSVPTMPSRAF